LTGGQGVAGSNPVIPTKIKSDTAGIAFYFGMRLEGFEANAPPPVADEGA
jgi:hypothetical protein